MFQSYSENSLAVQWLGLCAFTTMDLGLISGQGTSILQAVQYNQKKELFTIYLLVCKQKNHK